MSDLGLQHREAWNQLDRLPAEGKLGSSENTSKPRRCLFVACADLLCINTTWLALGNHKSNLTQLRDLKLHSVSRINDMRSRYADNIARLSLALPALKIAVGYFDAACPWAKLRVPLNCL
jgi:hypothetical protein